MGQEYSSEKQSENNAAQVVDTGGVYEYGIYGGVESRGPDWLTIFRGGYLCQ